MKKYFCVWLVLAMALGFSTVSFAQGPKGLYFGLIGGVSSAPDMSSTLTDQYDAWNFVDFDTSLKTGYLFGAKVGWQTPFTKKILAIELEYNSIGHKLEKMKNYGVIGDIQAEGQVYLSTFMANVIGRYPNGVIHPYAGFGLGYAYLHFDEIKTTRGGSPFFILESGSKMVGAYQLMAGVDIDVTKNFIIGIGYKYLNPMKAAYEA
ncbi:MAG: outer membrane beta-barrel protein, partial [Smithellaceae bacterium]